MGQRIWQQGAVEINTTTPLLLPNSQVLCGQTGARLAPASLHAAGSSPQTDQFRGLSLDLGNLTSGSHYFFPEMLMKHTVVFLVGSNEGRGSLYCNSIKRV